jgi:hypothetical protein
MKVEYYKHCNGMRWRWQNRLHFSTPALNMIVFALYLYLYYISVGITFILQDSL